MAYLEARAGIARAGVTYAGLSDPYFKITLGGLDRTAYVEYDGFTITHRLDGASSCVFTVFSLTPVIGLEVRIMYARPDEFVFVGTILSIECSPVDANGLHVRWHVTAVGEEWLLDRYDRVTARYASRGVGTMLADILYRFTDGGFRVGYCPSSLGNLSMDFTFETVVGAINRIASAVDGFWDVHDRVVNLYSTYPDAALPTLGNSSAIHRLRYAEDGTSLVTRKLYRAQGSAAVSDSGAGSATVSLEDVGPFNASGGSATAGQQVFTYTGKSVGAGTGALTGVSGLVDDIESGDEVSILVDVEDAAAQATLAAMLFGATPGVLSGQATDYHADGRLSESEATARATADLSAFSSPVKALEYSDTNRYVRVGRVVTANLTDPLVVSGTFRVQAIQIAPRGRVALGSGVDLWRRVSASRVTRNLTTVLKQLAA